MFLSERLKGTRARLGRREPAGWLGRRPDAVMLVTASGLTVPSGLGREHGFLRLQRFLPGVNRRAPCCQRHLRRIWTSRECCAGSPRAWLPPVLPILTGRLSCPVRQTAQIVDLPLCIRHGRLERLTFARSCLPCRAVWGWTIEMTTAPTAQLLARTDWLTG